ncbi:helix-turn-helix domain-containing protein [Horticoccus sp. 23ND18S-11]
MAEKIGLPLRELGERIGISTAMLFAYRSGKNPISVKAWKKLEQAERAGGLSPAPSFDATTDGDHQSGSASEPMLEREIRRVVEDVITAARGDVARMGWIREQVLKHLDIPDHWDIHEQVMREVLEEDARKQKADLQRQRSSGKTQLGAGR